MGRRSAGGRPTCSRAPGLRGVSGGHGASKIGKRSGRLDWALQVVDASVRPCKSSVKATTSSECACSQARGHVPPRHYPFLPSRYSRRRSRTLAFSFVKYQYSPAPVSTKRPAVFQVKAWALVINIQLLWNSGLHLRAHSRRSQSSREDISLSRTKTHTNSGAVLGLAATLAVLVRGVRAGKAGRGGRDARRAGARGGEDARGAEERRAEGHVVRVSFS